MKKIMLGVACLTFFLLLTGFNLDTAIVPRDEILAGGPPKDGIPAILEPEFIAPAKAYPLDWLRTHPGIHKDRLADQTTEIEVDSNGEIAAVRNQSGEPIAAIFSYWFAWQAFHPETKVFQPPRQ